jgi:hypothetical protein
MRFPGPRAALLSCLFLVAPALAAAQPAQPTNVRAFPRYNAPITMVLSWTDASINEDNFEIERREVGGAWSFLASTGPNTTSFEDATATADKEWEYRVRARSAATGNSPWVGPTRRMRPVQVWPMPDGDHDILHSFGNPLNFGGNRYWHEGVDISSSNVRVDAARGGQVTAINGGAGGTVALNVDMGAAGTVSESYLHITADPALAVGDLLSPGDQVGTVRNDWFNRALEADHVHWGDSSTNKLIPFTNPADRDPNEQLPQVADINNDGRDFILVRASDNNHNNALAVAWRDVDFLVDAFDDMAPTNNLMSAPFSLRYWILSVVENADTVQSAAAPYKLLQYDFPLVGAGAATPRENATSYWPLDADIQGLNTWQTTLTWILSNASDTAGGSTSPQAGEFWRTDARRGATGKENGSDMPRARENQEARFPDGEYFVNIVLEDLANKVTVPRSVIVDNSRPYVKSVRVFSGEALAYFAEWAWDANAATLTISPSSFDAASAFPVGRTRNINIEIEFSEPMATASIVSIAPLGVAPVLASSQPEKQRTVWRGTVSHLDVDDAGADDGQQTITISGTDLAGNALLQIGDRTPMPADHHNRDANGMMRGAAGNDAIHGFEIGPLEGLQNVIAIFMRAAPSDPPSPAIDAKATEIAGWLNDYFDETSYGTVSFAVTGHGWYGLSQPLASYYATPQSPLVDLVQEAISDAEADGVDLSGANYVLVVTDETMPRDEWSTTGGWPYETAAGTRIFASGVLNLASPRERASNTAGRMIGLVDLFAYPEVVVPRPFVGPWSHMSDRDTDVHPLGWEKWRAGWIDQSAGADKSIERVAKPPVAAPIVNRTFTIGASDSDTDELKAVAIEVADDLNYIVEYRRQQNLDGGLPDEGVVISRANDRVAQGEGPVVLTESNVTAGDLSDAPFTTAASRSTFSDPGSGVTLTVISMNAAEAVVRIDYAVPPFENDVYVADHDDRWQTIDIWVDAPDLAGNFSPDPRNVISAAEKPRVGVLNKVVGRVRNNGAADATNFEVELEILEPWGTGGTWRQLDVRTVPILQGTVNDPGDDFLIIADWTPQAGTHTCVRVRARTVPNDVNPDNNFTQENIHEFTSVSGSPYSPVVSRFQVDNPFPERLPIFFRLDGLPAGWTAVVNPTRPVLNPGEVIEAQVILQPADAAPQCVREAVTLTAYAPRIDTLKPIGAITLAVTTKSPARVRHEGWTDCDCDCPGGERRQCRVYTRGCTDPGISNAAVNILYVAPDGTKTVRTVNTDAEGCFVDFLPTDPAGGRWETTVELPESDCRDGGVSGPLVIPVADPEPQPQECADLKKRLAVLTDRMEEAIEKRDDDAVKLLFDTAQRLLGQSEDRMSADEQIAAMHAQMRSIGAELRYAQRSADATVAGYRYRLDVNRIGMRRLLSRWAQSHIRFERSPAHDDRPRAQARGGHDAGDARAELAWLEEAGSRTALSASADRRTYVPRTA